ncbi:hypothetical protein L3X38_028339 [Prunus dulcis]|uniref:Uncharacterized protein n=1 Tax=Prunus dulcis TaxID=3755 RepID=A0AAD4Z0C0_PRUDU|nr:hypothetical protein L3X38_028339 [Prunus dulcis]
MKKEKGKDNICKGECKKYATGIEVCTDAGGESIAKATIKTHRPPLPSLRSITETKRKSLSFIATSL